MALSKPNLSETSRWRLILAAHFSGTEHTLLHGRVAVIDYFARAGNHYLEIFAHRNISAARTGCRNFRRSNLQAFCVELTRTRHICEKSIDAPIQLHLARAGCFDRERIPGQLS